MISLSEQFYNELLSCGKEPIIEEQCPKTGEYRSWFIYVTHNGWVTAEGEKDFSVRVEQGLCLDVHLQALSENITEYLSN